jgi:hypothetical protein
METVFPLNSRNYKVSAAVSVSTAVHPSVRAILDTGAEPNLVRASILPDYWERYRFLGEPTLNIVGAGGRRLRQKGTVTTFLFINKHVTDILPKKTQVRLSDASVIPILRDSDPLQPRLDKEQRMDSPSTKVRVAKFKTVPSLSESLVWVQCAAPGLLFLQSQAKSHDRLDIFMADGIADILPLQPFPTKVLNTSKRDRAIPKVMVLGHASPYPKDIIALTSEEQPPVTERPDVEGELWKEELDLAHRLPQQRVTVFQILAKHQKMWDGRLGRVNATTHRSDLCLGPSRCPLNHTGPC